MLRSVRFSSLRCSSSALFPSSSSRCLPTLLSLPSQSSFLFSTPDGGATSSSPPSRGVIVQKFGGTSLGTYERMQKCVNIMKKFHNNDNDVIVVVSALSSDNKEEGTTSRLLQAATAAVEQEDFECHLRSIEDTHLDVIYTLLQDRKQREVVRNLIRKELNEISMFCSSLSVIREISARSYDKIVGCGERMSAILTSGILNDQGVRSTYVNLSNVFDALDTAKERNYQGRIKQEIRKAIVNAANTQHPQRNVDSSSNENNGLDCVPIVTGFFGQVRGGLINTFGRGYSDFTAALCAGAMDARLLQVWKESDGIFTGNPTKIEDAHLLSSVTPEEASELTSFGNEVLNPFTMNCCIGDGTDIQILNTFDPDGSGTVIQVNSNKLMDSTRSNDSNALNEDLDESDDSNESKIYKSPHGIIAVCSKKGIYILNLRINSIEGAAGSDTTNNKSLSKIFELFDKHNVRIDLISTSVTNISVAIHESASKAMILALVDELKELDQYNILNLHRNDIELLSNRAIVSCVGSGMKHSIGIASKIFTCLAKNDINIEMISQGSSEISISVVLHADQMDQAIKAIHKDYVYDERLDKRKHN